MDKLTYAATVIQKVHARTLAGQLKWDSSGVGEMVNAQILPSIRVSIEFEERDVEDAFWKTIYIHHPIGRKITLLTNPSGKDAGSLPVPSGETAQQIEEIFSHVVLKPRKADFEAVMKKLSQL